MSTPVVIIGWLLLVPSFLGILFGVLGLFATGSAATSTSASIDQEVRASLEAADIPPSITDTIVAGRFVTEEEKNGLSQSQQSAISSAALLLSASKVGAGAGTAVVGGLSIGIIVMSFVGGLIGWLLIMKKKVLQCPNCSAIVAAS